MPMIVDETYFPFRITRQIGEIGDDEFEDYLENERVRLHRRLAERARIVGIYDLSFSKQLSPKQREVAALWMRQHRHAIEIISEGTAFIVPNILLRGIVTAVFWLQKYPAKHATVKDSDSAVRWAIETAQAADLKLPDQLLRSPEKAVSDIFAASTPTG